MAPIRSLVLPLAAALACATAAADPVAKVKPGGEPSVTAAQPERWDGLDRRMLERRSERAGTPKAPRFPAEVR